MDGVKQANVADQSLKSLHPSLKTIPGYDDGHAFTSPVASFAPNGLLLHDTAGNVAEWCADSYDRRSYYTLVDSTATPPGPPFGLQRMIRAGSWLDDASNLRASYRVRDTPTYHDGARRLPLRAGQRRGDRPGGGGAPDARRRSAPPGLSRPDGRKAALSLTFDDARESQVDVGIPLLNELGVRATFYVLPQGAEGRGWKAAAAAGHEIGNHTVNHACSCNFQWGTVHVLEDYTLEGMERELLEANDRLEQLVGVRPRTFAYPCGQKFVGRGEAVRSYVPVVARHFRTGLYLGEDSNDPAFCDFAQLLAVGLDGLSFEDVRPSSTRRWPGGGG